MILRPSSADQWYNCPGQPRIASTMPTEAASDPAMEGTCAAWLAEIVFKGEAETCRDMVGEACPDNGWCVDIDMAIHIQKYVDLIKSRGGDIEVERRVYLTDNIHGTPDAYSVVSGSILYVDDLKYGYGIVEPTSKQVVIYAGAILNKLASSGVIITDVMLGIYQPRAYHPKGIHRQVRYPVSMFRSIVGDVIEKGHAALMPDAVAKAGKHCKYCKAASRCSALSGELYDAYHVMNNTEARPMSVDEMSVELDFISKMDDMLSARKSSIEAEAMARIGEGQSIPSYTVQRGYGKRRWTASREALEAVLLTDLRSDKMITPAEAERRGIDEDVVKSLSEVPQTKAKLTRQTRDDVRSLFGG